MPDATELCTLADIKSMLGITTTGQDALLTIVKDQAEQFAKTYCDRPFLVASYTEYYDGDGGSSLRLRQRPIVSVSEINYDPLRQWGSNSVIPLSDLIVDPRGYEVGWIDLFSYKFLRGHAYTRVIYSAGYSVIPTDLSMAVKTIVCKQFKVIEKKMWAETSRVIGDINIQLSPETFPKDSIEILDRYRRLDF